MQKLKNFKDLPQKTPYRDRSLPLPKVEKWSKSSNNFITYKTFNLKNEFCSGFTSIRSPLLFIGYKEQLGKSSFRLSQPSIKHPNCSFILTSFRKNGEKPLVVFLSAKNKEHSFICIKANGYYFQGEVNQRSFYGVRLKDFPNAFLVDFYVISPLLFHHLVRQLVSRSNPCHPENN
jgi:hypothetical protein